MRSLKGPVMSLPDEPVMVPGHGPLTTIGEERERIPSLLGGLADVRFVDLAGKGHAFRRSGDRGSVSALAAEEVSSGPKGRFVSARRAARLEAVPLHLTRRPSICSSAARTRPMPRQMCPPA